MSQGIIVGSTVGFSALTAQRVGAKDAEGIKKSFANSITVLTVMTAIVTFLCIFFSMELLEFLNTPQEVINDSNSYIMWIYIGLFATAAYNMLANVIRALGDSRTPLIFLIAASLVNIVLDIVLIKFLGMGVDGAGLATSISQLLAAVMCVVYIIIKLPELKFSPKDLIPKKSMVMALLHIGLPMGILNFVLSIGSLILQYATNGLGTVLMATFSAASRVENLTMQVIIGFGSAVTVFAAQNFGAKEYGRIRQGTRACCGITYIFVAILGIVMIFWGDKVMWLVAGDANEEIISNGHMFLIIESLLTVILVPLCILKCVLQAVGRAVMPVVSGIVEIFCRAGSAIFLVNAFGFLGLCFANPSAWLGGLIPIAIDYVFMVKWFKRFGRALELAKNPQNAQAVE